MKNILYILLFVFIDINANAEEKILECDGTWEGEGINLPKVDTPSLTKKHSVYQQFLVNDSSITEVSGTPDLNDDKIQLCGKSNTAYIYSRDFYTGNCAIKEQRRIAVDFVNEKDNSSKNSPFFKKWLIKPDLYYGASVIYLDRVNLSIIKDEYLPMTRMNLVKKNGEQEFTYHNFVIINHFKFQCKIEKLKL